MKLGALVNPKQRQEIKPHIYTQLIFTIIPRKHNGKSLFHNGAMKTVNLQDRGEETSLHLSFIQ